MSAVAVRAVAVDISRLLEPKGSSFPARNSHSPSSGPPISTPSAETSTPTSAHLPAPPPYQDYPPPPHPSPLEHHPQAPHSAYAAGPPPHESPYAPPGLAPVHAHGGYAPVNAPVQHGYDSVTPLKRPPSQDAHPSEPPAKKQSKWTPEENQLIIQLRGDGMKWDDVSKRLPGRSAISCRLHYQNFLERRPDWDEEKKNKLARLYERFRREMWERVAKELKMPWRAAEDMHWQLGRNELAQRAGVQPFHAAPESAAALPTAGVPITTSFVPTTAYQQPVYSASPQSFQPSSYPPAQGPPPGPHAQPGVYTYPPPSHYVPYPPPHSHPAHPPHHPPPTSAPQGGYPETSQPPTSYRQQHTPPGDAANRPRRSDSLTGTPAPSRLSPGATSPRRRALSASRISGASMPPIDARTRSPTVPASLPPLPREYYPGTPPAQGQQLPPVRFLTDEPPEDRRPPPPPPRSAAPAYYAHDAPREPNGQYVKAEERDDDARRPR